MSGYPQLAERQCARALLAPAGQPDWAGLAEVGMAETWAGLAEVGAGLAGVV